jgi:hypothetical protein
MWSIGGLTVRGNPKYSEKTPSQPHFVVQKSHMIWPGIEPALCNKKPATNHEFSVPVNIWDTDMTLSLVDLQLDAQNSYLFKYNTFIKILYMFRTLLFSSSGGLSRNCIYAASGIVTLQKWVVWNYCITICCIAYTWKLIMMKFLDKFFGYD